MKYIMTVGNMPPYIPNIEISVLQEWLAVQLLPKQPF